MFACLLACLLVCLFVCLLVCFRMLCQIYTLKLFHCGCLCNYFQSCDLNKQASNQQASKLASKLTNKQKHFKQTNIDSGGCKFASSMILHFGIPVFTKLKVSSRSCSFIHSTVRFLFPVRVRPTVTSEKIRNRWQVTEQMDKSRSRSAYFESP